MAKEPMDKESFWRIIALAGGLISVLVSVAVFHQSFRDNSQDEGLIITREWIEEHDKWAKEARERNLEAKAEGQERYLKDRQQQIEILTGLKKDLEHHEKDHEKE